ncbi:hypothetical protein W97_03158 [Coniosporium apollinis CBS 100218]|uniref:Dynactin subunit 5 n=1 Tax=Coniosporium apollinis (strain CBS 100218) TaxID=1168221 RepID=R7YPS9_CONA1|nr:uncharacterized protein W97_03158 [Coniosporium apollinis CBS 100218]EON63930.1 hypothetical protein W97_03158 [Coniosporium apollinis CBS 100218]
MSPDLESITDTGNKISRRAQITGTANITLGGKTVIQSDVVLRGDLHRLPQRKEDGTMERTPTAISIGRYTVISSGCVLRPPGRNSGGTWRYYGMKVGDNVFVGPNTILSSASISSHVHIGASCTLGDFSIINSNVKILPGTVVPALMVVPPGVVLGGQPARVVGELGEGWGGGGNGVGGGEEAWTEGGELRELVRAIR